VAIKPPDLLNRIPSVSELLEKPPLRALADRWNRSAVAASVRSFLEELGSDLQRRAADLPLPSIRELAERAAGYVLATKQHSLGVAINATGRIWGPPWNHVPLSDPALDRAMTVGREFATDSTAAGSGPHEFQTLACRLTGTEAATAVHSYSGALCLALTSLAAEREVLVARADVGEVETGDPLPKLVQAARCMLKEVGTANRATVADYESAITPQTGAILKVIPDAYRVVGETAQASVDELVALARDREMLYIEALGLAPLFDVPQTICKLPRSVRTSIADGTDVVVVRGNGLVAGPPCGLLLGRKSFLDAIGKHPLFSAWRLDPIRAAALTATLELYDNLSTNVGVMPAWQSLTAPVENLRNRAERLAPQLATAEEVASAIPVETRSELAACLGPEGGFPSFGIRVTAKDGNVSALDSRLKAAKWPVFGRVEDNAIILDLRTVSPRQDRLLVESVTGGSIKSANQPVSSVSAEPV
jgi:L-seryl-tRNA(Ser) seleniumtransferase